MAVDINDWMKQLSEYCESILENEDHPHYDGICVVSNWMTWLWEKPQELFTLEPELAEVKFGAWRELLDFHLWSDPEPLLETFQMLWPGQASDYMQVFRDCQGWAKEDLATQGYERLCPQHGGLVIPGESIPDPHHTQWTDRQELAGRVHEVRPGYAGYRKNGKVLAPATVIAYSYRAESKPTQ